METVNITRECAKQWIKEHSPEEIVQMIANPRLYQIPTDIRYEVAGLVYRRIQAMRKEYGW